ncbi:4-(cytidine 5'-diphospho)-2-C-methyl-D-erythritol kinase [Thalassomonas sp. M1454]|uniref:4-(cytidine 5'-diphospho)-2-C-methyl-D-erythritol kinase n=1 Tax=Thalassomonas sp. M1454 TaxID=2594477 RepID=UPI00117E6727|nr:4-(cytidine 5'-diphospho)-2-C-methyl-D-erythritol kinase [Thalassomonas sp. M1454]TRX56400.1 4-(cytidine 5'-diphospho)-2-C-methyl-D-erythritol kinase [Thalassomonas sp. M1454]
MSSAFIKYSSVAKINRFLHITGQRDDGYHQLETIFQFLDFGDYLHFKVNTSGEINLLTPIAGVDNNANLIVKAATALQQYCSTTQGVDIKLEKNLPMGGGLGGGSSNAATTLLALNKHWHLNLSVTELAKIGLKLGADVPVFVHGFTAFAHGIGEHLVAVDIDTPWFLVTIPDCEISTAAIFGAADLPRNTPPIDINSINLNEINIDQCHNDCENLVIKLYPEVAKLMTWLLEYAPSRLTGTGACIFSSFKDEKSALSLQSKLPNGVKSFVAKGLSQSPVINELL